MSILTKEEIEGIRKALPNRYPTVDEAVERGRDAAKAHGSWARPVIESLIETIEELQKRRGR